MQNLGITMAHIPDKSNMTGYLSRHRLRDIEEMDYECQVRAVIANDHAVVLDNVREETIKQQVFANVRSEDQVQ